MSKQDVYEFKLVLKRPMDVAANTSKKTLFISRASQMDRELAKRVFRFFCDDVVLDYRLPASVPMEQLLSEQKPKLLEVLRTADSDIVDIQLRVNRIMTYHRNNPDVAFDFETEGKTMSPNYFVFCEGDTEVAYTEMLRAHYRLPIHIIAKKTLLNITPALIERCKSVYVQTKNDHTYLMYDLDVATMLERLQKVAGAVLLCSNPCFELWLLLHYAEQKSELKSDECVSKLPSPSSVSCTSTSSSSCRTPICSPVDACSGR